MSESKRYNKEFRERAIRLVGEVESDYESQWKAIQSVAAKLGCTGQSLRRWYQQSQIDSGTRDGLTSSEREELKQLKKENKELKRSNEILRLASAFFAQAELDRKPKI